MRCNAIDIMIVQRRDKENGRLQQRLCLCVQVTETFNRRPNDFAAI